ncbi:MAG: hypothetical protein EA403_05100 [Spirochaetaceae bacterium]|nr:MAG: hypothetical protein EA403_05100 [Spirochaetaceae bacterium]
MLRAVLSICALFLLAACGEISLYAVLEAEEPGPFRMSQNEVLLPLQGEYTLTATGGFRPYTFELETDPTTGTVNERSGLFRAPESSTVASVVATDRFGARSLTRVRVYPPFRVTPQAIAVQVGVDRSVTVSGGVGVVQIVHDETRGTVVPEPGGVKYTAPAEAGDGTDRFELVDEVGNSAVVVVTLFAADALRLTAVPENRVIQPDGQVVFTASGGSSTYTFSVASPYNSEDHLEIDDDTATFSPVGGTQDAFVTVTDTSDPQQSVTARVIVIAEPGPDPQPLSISPSGGSFLSGTAIEFTASGGIPPYTFERVGPGSGQPVPVGTDKARYTVSRPPPLTRIRLTDHAGDVVEVRIDID